MLACPQLLSWPRRSTSAGVPMLVRIESLDALHETRKHLAGADLVMSVTPLDVM